jgi:hypothetical protein
MLHSCLGNAYPADRSTGLNLYTRTRSIDEEEALLSALSPPASNPDHFRYGAAPSTPQQQHSMYRFEAVPGQMPHATLVEDNLSGYERPPSDTLNNIDDAPHQNLNTR